MKKLMIFALVFILILSINCVRNKEWLNPVPEELNEYVDSLLTAGWRNYYNRNYDVAFAKFDTVTSIQGRNPDGYIGRGYASIDLGSDDPSSYISAEIDLRFVINTLEGKIPFQSIAKDTFLYSKMFYDALNNPYYMITPKNPKSILGLDNVDVTIVAYDSLNIQKTTRSSLFALRGDSIFIPAVNKRFIYSDSNVLFIPDTGTRFIVDVVCLKDSISSQSAAASLGLSQLYQVLFKNSGEMSDFWKSVIYANVIKRLYPSTIPGLGHYYDRRITSKAAKIILAQDYFLKGYYYSSMWEVIGINPDAGSILNPADVDFLLKLQQQISNLKP